MVEKRATTFNQVADLYDDVRPRYPQQLFNDLVELSGIPDGGRILEVGAGTGIATLPLAERGYEIVAVELGADLAGVAAAKLAKFENVDVVVANFEDWSPSREPFDLVGSATAWHWVDPTIRYGKAHALLRPGGHLAFWGARHAFPEGFDPFFSEIQEVYDEIGESHEGEWPPPPPNEVPDERAEIEASGLFEDVEVRRYVWDITYGADEYIALLNSFSGHISMEPAKREHLYGEIRRRIGERPDPTVHRSWLAILHVARRMGNDPNYRLAAELPKHEKQPRPVLKGLVVLIGPPGSGKTTFLDQLATGGKIAHEDVVSSDAIGEELFGPGYGSAHDSEIFAERDRRIVERLTRHNVAFADSTNVRPEARRRLLNLARRAGVSATALRFPASLETVLRQDKNRDKHVDHIRGYHDLMSATATREALIAEGFSAVFDVPGSEQCVDPAEATRDFDVARD